MFDVVGLWAVKLMEGEIDLPGEETMDRDCGTDYPYDLDVGDMFHTWEGHKDQDILTYRDQSFASKFTGVQSPVHHTNFMFALDDSLETFMTQAK
eukprot:GFUD01124197.1.p1 GENE.GFUD01124197.1~~GFUD01124197.1.p1  ORF type:complete len:111 (+),score=40.99 GFUD01124197.1:50-334(+)